MRPRCACPRRGVQAVGQWWWQVQRCPAQAEGSQGWWSWPLPWQCWHRPHCHHPRSQAVLALGPWVVPPVQTMQRTAWSPWSQALCERISSCLFASPAPQGLVPPSTWSESGMVQSWLGEVGGGGMIMGQHGCLDVSSCQRACAHVWALLLGTTGSVDTQGPRHY